MTRINASGYGCCGLHNQLGWLYLDRQVAATAEETELLLRLDKLPCRDLAEIWFGCEMLAALIKKGEM